MMLKTPDSTATSKLVLLTCWRVREGRGVVSQLLPPAVSTVHPAAEAHQHQPRRHAQARDERRLPDDVCDLLRYAEVAALLHGRGGLVSWESWR